MTIPNFNYDSQNEWKNQSSNSRYDSFPKCVGSHQQSPINIDTSQIFSTDGNINHLCNQYCRLSINYKPSNCYTFTKNNIPFVRFDPGSYIFYGGKKVPYYLTMMSLHTPSNHTINASNEDTIKPSGNFDMEVILYHTMDPINLGDGDGKFNDITNTPSSSDPDTINGVAISVLLKKGSASSNAHTFLSQFINQLSTDDTGQSTEDSSSSGLTTEYNEIEIKVKEDWSPELLLPNDKKFFTYKGSLPFPPCNPNWQWIIFEKVQSIGKTLFNFFELPYKTRNVFTNRIADINPESKVYYNNNPKLFKEDKKNLDSIEKQMELLMKQKEDYEKELDPDTDNVQEDTPFDTEAELLDQRINKLSNDPVYQESKVYIKSAIWGLILILILACAIKIVKNFIHTNDYVASFAIRRVQNTMNKKGEVSENQNSFLEEIKKQIGLKRKLKETEKKIKEFKKYNVSKSTTSKSNIPSKQEQLQQTSQQSQADQNTLEE